MADVRDTVVLKLLFVSQDKADGTKFKAKKTILVDENGVECWVNVKFGDEVNEKQFKETNCLIKAYADNVSLPKSYVPYTDDNGVNHYPYVWVNSIISFKALKAKNQKATTQASFSVDEEDLKMPWD